VSFHVVLVLVSKSKKYKIKTTLFNFFGATETKDSLFIWLIFAVKVSKLQIAAIQNDLLLV
jgi:hypothetical protein